MVEITRRRAAGVDDVNASLGFVFSSFFFAACNSKAEEARKIAQVVARKGGQREKKFIKEFSWLLSRMNFLHFTSISVLSGLRSFFFFSFSLSFGLFFFCTLFLLFVLAIYYIRVCSNLYEFQRNPVIETLIKAEKLANIFLIRLLVEKLRAMRGEGARNLYGNESLNYRKGCAKEKWKGRSYYFKNEKKFFRDD